MTGTSAQVLSNRETVGRASSHDNNDNEYITSIMIITRYDNIYHDHYH